MRITFVIYSLSAGGAERIMSIMSNYWAEKDWNVTIITISGQNQRPFFELHSSVAIRHLDASTSTIGLFHGIANNIRRIQKLRRAIVESDPQVVISFMDQTNIITILAATGLNLPVIVAEHNDPYQRKIGPYWAFVRQLVYIRASQLIVLNKTALNYFSALVRKRARVMFNPVVLPADSDAIEKPRSGHGKTIVAMGRLVDQKGFDMLLRAFDLVAAKHLDWSLEIWGDGPLRSELEAQRRRLQSVDRVRLPGITKSPFGKMKRAEIFVLSSRYEGFPTVLCEAMACGTAVISFDCQTGPAEIIRDGVDGILVPAGDVHALADAMDALMSNEQYRKALATQATNVLDRFGLEKTMNRWETMIGQFIHSHS